MSSFFYYFFNLDQQLLPLVAQYGSWVYGLLFLLVFCETGLVFTPFLPGDSLLFVAGTMAAKGALNPWILWLVFVGAAVLGDFVNYNVGGYFGKRLERSTLIKKEYLEKTHEFYARYGKKTIVLARFVPIVRTFAPFVAGMGRMQYREFFVYNVVGAVAWVSIFLLAGFFFGQVPWVSDHLELVILGIIVISLVPPVLEYLKAKRK